MGTTSHRVNKAVLGSLFFLASLVTYSQQPFINNINPTRSEVGQTVEIAGQNLGGTPRVFFGGVESPSVTVNSANLLSAEVPAGAANAPIYVLNNNEIAQSGKHFFISYGGNALTDHDAEFTVSTTELAASDLCLCDLNGDSKNDIVIVQNRDADPAGAEATIFLNNLTGTGALSGSDFEIGQSLNVDDHNDGFVSVACGDLDNDGDNDLAFTSNFGTDANDVFILRNPGTGVFATAANVSKTLPVTSGGDQRQPGSIVIADLDRDGRLDLAVGNNASDGVFHIFRNTGGFSFANAVEITANNEPTGLLYAADLNNDGFPDLITLAFRESNSGIHLFRNQSTPNNFSFAFDQTITNGGQNSDVEVGDLDNDGDLDIVVASNLTGRISYFENQSTSNLSFGNSNNLSSSANSATGVSLADMNGDGQLDILSSNGAGGIYLFPNTTAGAITFGGQEIENTGGSTRNAVTGDLNGDGKPDIAYTRDVQLDEVGSLGLILNRNCIVPEISPNDLDYCLNDPFTLSTFNAVNATYNWEVLSGTGAITTNGNPDAEITITAGTTAQIRVTITQNGCSEQSTVNLSVAGGAAPAAPTIQVSSAGVLCTGDAVTLSSSTTSDNYFWTLPDGSESASPTIQLNPITVNDAGTYTLMIQDDGGCRSDIASQTIEVNSPPTLSIVNNGLLDFCNDLTLEVPDYSGDGINYQWKRGGTNLGSGDQNDASVSISQSGSYTVETTDGDGCSLETASVTVNKIALPVSDVDGPTETCQNFLTSFTATSTGATGFSLLYDWSIEDPSNAEVFTSTDDAIDFSFPEIGTYTITLNTSYDPNEVFPGSGSCSNTRQISLTVSSAPTSITFDQPDVVQKCQNEALTVGITSPSANDISSYSWVVKALSADTTFNTSSSPTIDVTTPVGFDEVYAIASITNTIGCTITDTVLVRNFATDVDISSPDFTTILDADTARLEDAISISLSAENLVSDIQWEPSDFFDAPNTETTQFFPRNPESVVTLSGVDADGCNVSTEVTIRLANIRPKKVFSPNADGINDCWEILNIGTLGEQLECQVYIFDSRGRNIVDAIESFDPNNCVWNGTASGVDVPEGIYYYVLKCDQGEAFSQSGSILLAR